MFRKFLAILITPLLMVFTSAQAQDAYLIFSNKGKEISLEKAVKKASESQVVLFGELHNSIVAHWLQLQFLEQLSIKHQVIFGGEQFETDQQILFDELHNGFIDLKQYKAEARKWNNYEQDYEPLIKFCVSKNIPMVATNVPRRYATMVARNNLGVLDSLSAEAKTFICPLPLEVDFEIPGYPEMRNMMHNSAKAESFISAQALKDATMAHRIEKNLKENAIFFHINGSYHSNKKGGIYAFLKKSNPDLTIYTIAVVESETMEFNKEEYSPLADLIIVVNSTFPKSY
ncbi:MAG: ChaN family lipoprotein [Luteibaculaceae bacterium]